MKLRLHGNSLRLRLSQRDTTCLRETGRVEESIQFAPGSRLTYAIESTIGIDALHAQFDHGSIRVLVPLAQTRQWLDSDEIGISFEPPGGAGPALLIEKDFRCLHPRPREQDDTDSFPNPQAETSNSR